MKCPYCSKLFNSWKSVSAHTAHCSSNSGEYYIHKIYGPLHYSTFNTSIKEVRAQYPLINDISTVLKNFAKRNIVVDYTRRHQSPSELLENIRIFYNKYNRVPQYRDFSNNVPQSKVYVRRFGSWNEAIKAAGFEPNENDGFGTRTIANDGVLYRSHYETMFVNKFLFNKEIYKYEVKYSSHNKYYDFYLPERDIYIEIDGGCRPTVMEEKIEINKELGRNLFVIKGNEVATFKGF